MSQLSELVDTTATGVTVTATTGTGYLGDIGKTNMSTCQVKLASGALAPITICTGINAITDPALAEIVRGADGLRLLHTVSVFGEQISLAQSVMYHDPSLPLLVLVVPHGLRHRSLHEHREALQTIADHGAAPAYVTGLQVVCGSEGLIRCITAFSEQKRAVATIQDGLELRAQLAIALQDIASLTQARDHLALKLDEMHNAQSERLSQIAIPENVVVAESANAGEQFAHTEPTTEQLELDRTQSSGAVVAELPQSPSGGDHRRQVQVGDYAVEMRSTERDLAPSWLVTALAQSNGKLVTRMSDGNAVLALTLAFSGNPGSNMEPTSDSDGVILSLIGWRLLMPRVEGYPMIVIVLEVNGQVSTVYSFDPGHPQDVSSLETLALTGCIQVVVASGDKHRRFQLLSPLAENVGYLLRAANEDLSALSSEQKKHRAMIAHQVVTDPAFDVTSAQHPEAGEFRVDKLRNLQSVTSVRRALALARRYAKGSREDYLICNRGFPIVMWRQLRKDVLTAAVGFGMWMGPELAPVAVSIGLARSRRDLVVRMESAFEAAKRNAELFDLDADAAADNALALQQEAIARGVGPVRIATTDQHPAVAHSEIAAPVNTKAQSVDDLLSLLSNKWSRVAAAIELCERGDDRAAPYVIDSVKLMNRSEAVRVLGMSVRFGASAVPALQEGLASSKAYLRHGCALALAMLRTEAGTAAVIDLLLTEPTDIWREIARAVGQMGVVALAPLQLKVESYAAPDPTRTERTAWAMAHVAARGGKAALLVLASSNSVAATSAIRGLKLLPIAAQDQVRIAPDTTGTSPGREVTVNRAFSRRFFESLDTAQPAVQPAMVDTEVTGAVVALNDEDLIFDAELLDDEDALEVTEADMIA